MRKKPVVRTVVSGIFAALLAGLILAANIMLPAYNMTVSTYLGDKIEPVLTYPDSYSEDLDLQYSKAEYSGEDLSNAEKALNIEAVGEGAVLLQNENGLMPFDKDTSFSFFSAGSKMMISNTGYDMALMFGAQADPGQTLGDAFKEEGFSVNETLEDFYWKGGGKDYRLGLGSVNFGDAEDFSINECPLSELEKADVLKSAEGTVPVFVWSRRVGEGRDMPRSMYNHAESSEDQQKSYLEPDSKELEILSYLNDNFDEIVLLVNSSAAMELGWTEDFENIHSILYVPSTGNEGLHAVAKIFSGETTPSGHTVDSFSYDAFSAPASINYGDYQYMSEDGEMTKYNYVYYQEGIYVGYRYFETRYEDAVMKTGNAGDYDYASTVKYPFGYGLSYTDFTWSDFSASEENGLFTVTVNVENTGDFPGKDVVEIYAQQPYTDYDRENGVEKSAAILVGYEKTGLLQPGEKETVTVTFDKSQLKSYDANGAGTYILDEGDYYVSAAGNVHEAVNNILAAKGYTEKDGMTDKGDKAFSWKWHNDALDTETFAVSENGTKISNQFDFADGGITYLSRNDWEGTWPEHQGEVSTQLSSWGNEINGEDGVSYTYTRTLTDAEIAQLDSFDSLSPLDPASLTDTPVYGKKNNLQLIEMRGLSYEDPKWEDLLDQVTEEEYQAVITQSGYGNPAMDSINKAYIVDQDAANGIVNWMGSGDGFSFQTSLTLAQSWNRDLAERIGKIIGDQAYVGVPATGWYAPATNIHRLPFSGRNGEYYSEDGFLSGSMASTTARGVASKGLYTFVKHFALNDQENHRGDREGQFSMATWADEQAIREIYLLPFQMCMESGNVELNYLEPDGNGGFRNAVTEIPAVNAIMTSFNRIGMTWAGGCYPLLTNVLRGEWGFKGFAVTDNANTGLFMDAGQMIEAGGDAKLTNEPGSARWTFDPKNSAQYHYAREAVHHILYAVVNSKAMNGQMPGAYYKIPMSIATKIQIGVTVVGLFLINLLIFAIVSGWKKYRISVSDARKEQKI